MKENKFRAWDIDKKIMLDCWEGYGHTSQWGINNIFRDSPEYIFEQYIGKKDKNGKEIFKGDIYKDQYGIGPIEYNSQICAFYWGPGEEWGMIPDDGEVIGNIHEGRK